MKKILLVGMCSLLFSVPVCAESMYISDIVKITLRSGPGTDHRVIAMLQSGQAVDILNAGDEWSQVKLSDGREGWVFSRLLTPDKPRILLLDQTTQRNLALTQQISDLTDKNKLLAEENRGLASELAQLKAKLGEIDRSYAKLQRESTDFLAVQSKYRNSARDLDIQTQRANELEAGLNRLKSDQNIKWFLIGAGVLLVGVLLGMSAKRQQRRYMVL